MEQQGRRLIVAGLIVFPGVWILFIVAAYVDPLWALLNSIDRNIWEHIPIVGLAPLYGFLETIAVPIGFALITAGIAVRKGRHLWFWLVMGLLFPLIALIVVLFLRQSADVKVEAGLKKCPHCSEWVDRTAAQCRYCLGALPTPDPA